MTAKTITHDGPYKIVSSMYGNLNLPKILENIDSAIFQNEQMLDAQQWHSVWVYKFSISYC